MAGLSGTALAISLAAAAPAAAQHWIELDPAEPTSHSRFNIDVPMHAPRPGLSFPVVEFTTPDGRRTQRRGIIAGKQVAPGTVLGIGLFETLPKARRFVPEHALDTPKRKRRAAVGVSVRF